jgi:hypothetical protein
MLDVLGLDTSYYEASRRSPSALAVGALYRPHNLFAARADRIPHRMKRIMNSYRDARALFAAIMLLFTAAVAAAEFNIRDYGARPNDDEDDTRAIAAALEACGKAGGGTVVVPAGTYVISRQGAESPILQIPSNTTLRGEGDASVLKFSARVNQTNFWRMLGAAGEKCSHITICDLRLDGSNTHGRYEKGKTAEQNHGIFLYAVGAMIEDVTLRHLLVENFSGDCVAVGRGCRNVTIRDVRVRNFLRQGIQLAGSDGARDYLVTGCQDLEPTVQPGGSTIHVEHARGLRNVIISNNLCRQSILAGGVDGLILENNIVTGRIVGNGNKNMVVRGNIVRGSAEGKSFLVQLGHTDGLILRDNLLVTAAPGQSGIYVWGSSKFNPEPSRQVSITGNTVRPADRKVPADKGIMLNGVEGGSVRDNLIEAATRLTSQRVKEVTLEPTDPSRPAK